MSGEVVTLWDWLRERWPYASTVKAYDERSERSERGELMETHNIEEDIEIPEGMGEVTPIKKLIPGDILDVVIKLRKMLSSAETTAFTLYASFEELGGGPGLQKEVEKTRHTMELMGKRLNDLLTLVEKTDAYTNLRRDTIAKRKQHLHHLEQKK